jgi:hypothetical protein
MLGPPNHGAELAEKLGQNVAFQAVFGQSGDQLARGWPALAPRLTTPACQFAILAGGRGDDRGWNPLVAGDDDGVVSVATTRLPGARDFAVLPVGHTFMMYDPIVQEYTLRFLREGHFVSNDARRPIMAENDK